MKADFIYGITIIIGPVQKLFANHHALDDKYSISSFSQADCKIAGVLDRRAAKKLIRDSK